MVIVQFHLIRNVGRKLDLVLRVVKIVVCCSFVYLIVAYVI